MASGIQQGIASKYYAMADQARTPDQINQVRQLLAKTIQSGGLPAYEGIPIVEQLNGKYQTALQQQAMAGQTKAGLISPTSQPMAQEILAQAEQPDEEDSGIDELASNLPTEEYAEGGIVGFAGGGVTGGGEMQLTVPISIGGENGSGPYTGFGGSGFNGGGGYAPPGGPQGGSAGSLGSLGRGAQQMQPPGAAPQAQVAQAQGAQMNMQENAQMAQGMSNDVNGFTPIQTNQGTLLAGQFLQGLSGMPDQQKSSNAMGSMPFNMQAQSNNAYAPQQEIGMARGGIVGLAGGGGIDEALEKIFGRNPKFRPTITPSGTISNVSLGQQMKPPVPPIGPSIVGSSFPPPNLLTGTVPSIDRLGPAPTANEKGIGKLIPNFDPNKKFPSASFLSKIGQKIPGIGGYLTAASIAGSGIQGLVDSDSGTASEFLDPIAAMQGSSGGTDKGKPQLDGSATKNVPKPDAIPPNVQTVLDQYKNSKKLGDTLISNKPNAPAKAPAAPVVKEEPVVEAVKPPEPVVDTTPKEDTISRLEKMFTQPPEQKKKERDLDFYTRLFQAGIGVASGSSRNALENLKEAQPAIAGFASDIARQREEDRNRIKDLASLGLKREEFAFKLKELGIAEKKVDSLTKHYDDYLKLGQERNKLLGQHYGNIAKNYANAAGAAGNKLAQTLTIAQDRNIKDLIKTYANNPKYMNASPAELRALAMQSLGYGGGGGGGGPAPITWNNLIAPTK